MAGKSLSANVRDMQAQHSLETSLAGVTLSLPVNAPSFLGDSSITFEGFALRFDLLFAFAAGVSSRLLFWFLLKGDRVTGELSIV